MKRHSKRDVLCCWRNGLWAVARCIEKLKAARLESLTSTLYVNVFISNFFCILDLYSRYEFTTKYESAIVSELVSPAMSSGALKYVTCSQSR